MPAGVFFTHTCVMYVIDIVRYRSIFDSEDSFPTGAIRAHGRIFMHPDLVNIQKLDGKLFNAKYLLIARNLTVWLGFSYCIFVVLSDDIMNIIILLYHQRTQHYRL